MRILITGANGFLGQRLGQSLINEGYDVYLLTKPAPHSNHNKKVNNTFHIDLRGSFRIDVHFDFVFHLAAHNITNVGESRSQTYLDINVKGTINLLKGVSTSNLIYVSTVNLYDLSKNYIDENSETLPDNAYETSKLNAENVCRKHYSTGNLFIFRTSSILGYGQARKSIVPVVFDRAMSNDAINIFVPPTTSFHYIYVNDVIGLFCELIKRPCRAGLYNLSSKPSISVYDLVEKICWVSKSKSTVSCSNNDEPRVFEISTEKLRKEYRWEPRTSIDFILDECYQSLKG